MCRNVFLDAKACLKALFGCMLRHGKSPCFSGLASLSVFSVDDTMLNCFHDNGVKFFERTY
jgi:hypothetical protein